MMNKYDYNATIAYAKKEGLIEGEARGVAIGEVRGETRGLERTARAMKAGGESISKIMRYTGLSRNKIMALR